MDLANVPKIDLHCHLDGSLSPAFLSNVLKIPCDDNLITKLRAPRRCASLAEYLTRFDLPLSALTKASLFTDAVRDVLRQAAAEGVVYTEIRFAPMLSFSEELSLRDIAEGALEGLKSGTAEYGIRAGLIFCGMRHHTEEQNLETLRLTREYLGEGVVGFDLAGDEAAFGNHLFENLFATAKKLSVPVTIHSGECGSTENVKLAIAYGAKRVGHGIAMIKDRAVIEQAKDSRLGFELCPISNYQTGAVKDGETYPLKNFLDAGLLASVHTDNRTVSNTTMTKELAFCMNELALPEEYILQMYRNSVEMSFADDETKNRCLAPLGA